MQTHKKWILVILIVILLACSVFLVLNLNKARTILSLKKVDNYPLYSMRYYGDYNLDYSVPESHRTGVNAEPDKIMCTCFLARNEAGDPLFCRNLDYTLLGHQISVLLTDAPGKNAALTTVDLNYLGYSKENPPDRSLIGSNLLYAPRITIDGINEYGLAVAILAVPIAEPPFDPNKPDTDEVGMMRLILDDAKTIDEAVEIIKQYNILFHEGAGHFMIADASGDSAVIEFIDGQVVVFRTDTDWQVCTNFILSQEDRNKNGLFRYETAMECLNENSGILSEEQAMQLLSDVSQDSTVWSVIYNLRTGEMQIAMGKKYEEVNCFDLQMHNE